MKPLKKIMVVEDDPDIRTIAKIALETVGGFEVELCDSGKWAVTKAREFQPDLILLDVMMPEMDGIATFKTLQEAKDLAQISIIFMTAKTQTHEVAFYQSLGAIDVIMKPFDPMNLAHQLKDSWEKIHG